MKSDDPGSRLARALLPPAGAGGGDRRGGGHAPGGGRGGGHAPRPAFIKRRNYDSEDPGWSYGGPPPQERAVIDRRVVDAD